MPIVPPKGEEIYREHMPFPLAGAVVAIQLLIGLFFLGLLVLQIVGVVESGNPPIVMSVIMAAVFLGVAWLVTNFLKFTLALTPGAVELRFGVFKTEVPFEQIEAFERDSRPALAFGGFGLRVTVFKDGLVKAYMVIGKPKIDLVMKTGKFKHIVFPTEHPDQVLEILRERLKNAPGHVRSPF